MENLKRSWKNSWQVMEFKELRRVQTLLYLICFVVKRV